MSLLSSIFRSFLPRGDRRSRSYASSTYYYNTAKSTTTAGNNNSNSYFYFPEILSGSRKMGKGKPLSLQTVELKVRMCCTGCEKVVRNALLKLRGVDSVDVNLELEKVTVIGYLDRNKVLKEVRRSGKKAEFWPNPDLPLYFTCEKDYFHDHEESFKESYNYWKHGYNGDKHGQIPVPHRGDHPVSNMFNDDDVNACAVM